MKPWTREDIIIAYALYCITPLQHINTSNKTLQQTAMIMNRSLPSLIMRMRNFYSIDTSGVQGLGHVAKADKQIFEEYKNDWGLLSYTAEQLTGLALFDSVPDKGAKPLSSLTDHRKVSRERHFFRASVFAAYDNHCCITGLTLPSLLVASHIKPYNKCRTSQERTDPHNGLLLNTFYDKAFDQGLITVDPGHIIHVSSRLNDYAENEFVRSWLLKLEGQPIINAQTFQPDPDALQYHNDVIFKI